MRVVLDTNVLVAAFIAHGQCNELLEHCVLHHEVIVSDFLLAELGDVLARKFGFGQAEIGKATQLLLDRCQVVAPFPLVAPLCRDPDDDQVLATAITGRCRCVVTGDKDLLCLEEVQQVRMISPGAFWAYEGGKVEQEDGQGR
ncbi:MAG: putative toxin-antitoxin system toxin component, PIN family [Lentisphaeria bacterium]|nr:putative toxin-antitoxin system toxin component, PIN family [Lentisphaeria bacterium]